MQVVKIGDKVTHKVNGYTRYGVVRQLGQKGGTGHYDSVWCYWGDDESYFGDVKNLETKIMAHIGRDKVTVINDDTSLRGLISIIVEDIKTGGCKGGCNGESSKKAE